MTRLYSRQLDKSMNKNKLGNEFTKSRLLCRVMSPPPPYHRCSISTHLNLLHIHLCDSQRILKNQAN